MNKYVVYVIIVIGLVAVGLFIGKHKYDEGYDRGYNVAYSKGYQDGYADKGKLADSSVKTETKVVYKEIPYNGNDVQIRTEKPVVTVSVNGKQQKVEQHTNTADLAVKTETAVKIKIPERRWHVGIGTDGKNLAGTIKIPVKDAVGVWISGTKGKVMGGLSISF